MAALTGVTWIILCLFLPETYAPVLLRKRAEKLSELNGKIYRSRLDLDKGKATTTQMLKTALSRPWILLFREPIVFLCSTYMAVVYGTLYMLFDAYPIVFQEVRGWGEGVGGLAFLGVLVGMLLATVYTFLDNIKYARLCRETPGRLPPEYRLSVAIVGSFSLPIGLFWFAWTNSPSIHWMSSIAAGAPFGFGMVLVFLGIMNYLVDSYVIFAASVLAANSAMRSTFGAIFPLFTTYMYRNLGIHWASCVPAFLSLACVPFPIVFYYYGPRIRQRCTFAAEADQFMERLTAKHTVEQNQEHKSDKIEDSRPSVNDESQTDDTRSHSTAGATPARRPRGDSRASRTSQATIPPQYEENPYNIDRVNTINSAISGRHSKS